MSDFIHLHNHSDFSLLDGAQKVDAMINTLGDLNMSAVGLTDHGNLFGMLPFYKAAKEAGVRPIIGCEVYVAQGDHLEKKTIPGQGWGYNHLVLMAENEIGLKNLIKLVSIGYVDGFYYRPRVDMNLIRKHHEGLIATSGCLKGIVQENAVKHGYDSAKTAAIELAEVFHNRFYLELQRHGIPEEDAAVEINIKLARELNLPLVATNDCHYARKEHWEAHDVMFCLGTGKDRDDPNRQRYATPEFYLKSVDEMYNLFKDVPEAIENTVAIAERCQADLQLGNLQMPVFPIPGDAGTKNEDDYLRMMTEQGLADRYNVTEIEQARLDRELQVIKGMGYAGYFLITMDFIRYAREQNIPVGPGRGSAAGSLVAYALGITNVDPLKYNLLFERFLNPDRVSMPDIDIDFCQERRGEVIDYVKALYGEEAVCQIITFGKMKAKSVVRDVGRVLGMSYGEADRIAKMIPDTLKTTIDSAMKENPDLKVAAEQDVLHQELFDHSRVLEGMNRHASTHAAGVVIAPGDLTDYVPLYRHPKTGDITTQVDMNGLEDMGLLKMDFLGLRTLTVIDKAQKMLRNRGIHIDPDKFPLDDEATYKIFARGQTIGVFQFESAGMREFLSKLKPTCLEDLIAMNALYRPGPMAYIDDFIDRKNGKKKITYLHPNLEPILEETYGIIVYQEQVMQIANAIAGFTLAQADIMRRAMGKKKEDVMKKMGTEFVAGAKTKGVDQKVAKEIYDLIVRFAQYGFNKSHSTAYALVAYQTAYLKAHYPAEFMAANMSTEMSNIARMPILLAETQDMHLEVRPPEVNYSSREFRVDDEGRIIFGLNAIKHVGVKAADHIAEIRGETGNWTSLAEFLTSINLSTVNKKAIECLIKSGACDSLEGNRHAKFEGLEACMRYAQAVKSGADSNQEDLFGGLADAPVAVPPPLQDIPSWTDNEHFEFENELTGFFLSGHPLKEFDQDLKEFSNYNFEDPQAGMKMSQIRLGGIVTQLKTHMTKKGLPMAFFTLETMLGKIEVVVFAELFAKVRSILVKDAKVFVLGKPSTRSSATSDGESEGAVELKMLGDEIFPLEDSRRLLARHINIRLFKDLIDSTTINKINAITLRNRGNSNLRFHWSEDSTNGSSGTLRIKSTNMRVTPAAPFLSELRELLGQENVWATPK